MGPARTAVTAEARSEHQSAFVFDLHAHAPRFVPQPFRAVFRAGNPRRPRDAEFGCLAGAGVDAVVAKAVGDPIVTRWYVGRSPWAATDAQLGQVEHQAEVCGALVGRTSAELRAARDDARTAVVLGVEGADPLADDVDNVDRWHQRGVRVVGLVHLGDNALGTTCLPWQQYVGRLPVRRTRAPGLSAFGAEVVQRMNTLGMVVDVAHADTPTLMGVIDAATAPVISSHSGARSIEDFARYLTDQEMKAIAATGGLVGLWPYRAMRHGARDVPELIRHARHVADLVGPGHLCLGTDMNGVPGLMRGYAGEHDLVVVTAALMGAGFSRHEMQGILGGNALRVFADVEAVARR